MFKLNKYKLRLIFFNMSFFNDFIDSISIDDIENRICCNLVFDCGVKVSANFKIENLQENEIILKCKKNRIRIIGRNLKIVTLAKGELEVAGNIDGVVRI